MQLKANTVYALFIILKVCSAKIESKIVGGKNANIRDWPFIAFIVYTAPNTSGPACGGSILSSQTILTAAHCLDHPTNYKKDLNKYVITVLMGSANIFKTTMYGIAVDYQTHQKYKIETMMADIGIVFLKKPVTFSDTVQKTVLFSSRKELSNRARLLAAGWGYWSESVNKTHPLSKDLQVLDQYHITRRECKTRVDALERGTICAGASHPSKFIYSGDSGGPLVTLERHQLGVVSYKIENGDVTVYTHLPYYRDWIEQTQQQLYKQYCSEG